MELCKKCNGKHDLKKACKSSKKKEDLKKLGSSGAPMGATLGESIAAGIRGSAPTAPTAPTVPGIKKSEQAEGALNMKNNRPMSYNDMKKSEAPVKPEEKIVSISELKKREEDMMALEDKTNSLAAHIKDVLKKIK